MKKKPSADTVQQAIKVVRASQGLNYKRILAHDPDEVDKLNRVLKILRINPANLKDRLQNYASKPDAASANRSDNNEKEMAAARRRSMTEALGQEGFGDRMGMVYNSFSRERMTPIGRVPHLRGLPRFELVLAPDFAPMAGMHGIFIAGNTVRSIVLPSDAQPAGEWRTLKQKSFNTLGEMTEIVTLIAAGFDLD